MIESIHNRLLNWAEAVRGGVSAGSLSSLWDKMASGDFSSSQSGSRVLISAEVDEIEKAVLALPEVLRETVKEFYLNEYSTIEQKMKHLGVSKKTLYRRIDKAHGEIRVGLG